MAKKTREPARLGHADYCKWFEQMIGFKEDRVADGTWPDHLDANFQVLFNNLWDAWDTYDRINNELKKTTYKAYDEASKPVYNRLVSLRELIPTLFEGDDSVLGEFGLARKVPRDKEDLFTMASGCLEHWDDLVDGGLPSEYDPVEPMFALFADEYDAFQTAYTAYIAKTRDVEEAQNLFIEKRELCHHKERLIFHWFKGLHMDGEDEWWTATLWGTVSGGGGEPSVVYPVFPEPPETFTAEDKGGGMTEVVYGYVDGATHGLLERRKAGSAEPWIEVSDHLPMDKDNMLPYRELHVPPGEWEYRFTPMNGDEHGTSVSATVVVGE